MSLINKSSHPGSLNSENRMTSLQSLSTVDTQIVANGSNEEQPKNAIDFAAAALMDFRHRANTDWTRK